MNLNNACLIILVKNKYAPELISILGLGNIWGLPAIRKMKGSFMELCGIILYFWCFLLREGLCKFKESGLISIWEKMRGIFLSLETL